MLEKLMRNHIILCVPKITHTLTDMRMHAPLKTLMALAVDICCLIEI